MIPALPEVDPAASRLSNARSFTRSPQLKEESSFLASVCPLLGVLPQVGTTLNHRALARGDELALGNCRGRGALIMLDRAAFGAPSCVHCGTESP